MAGIGFRLRELVEGDSYLDHVKGYGAAVMICAGPWLSTVLVLAVIATLARRVDVELAPFMVSLVYAYAGAYVIAGLVQLPVTRYLADRVFAGDRGALLPTVAAGLVVLVAIQLPLGVAIAAAIEAPPLFRLGIVTLFVTIGATSLVSVCVGVVRAFSRIVHGFLLGSAVSLVGAAVAVRIATPTTVLWVFTLGQFIVLAWLLATLLVDVEPATAPDYGFLTYYRRYRDLAPCGALFCIGVWADKAVYWFGGPGRPVVPPWFYAYDAYDTGAFLAQLSTLPALVLFFVKAETAFYRAYRAFYDSIVAKAGLTVLRRRRMEIQATVSDGLRTILIWQALATFVAVAFPERVFRFAAGAGLTLPYVRVQTLSAFFTVLLLIAVILLMYFEFYRESLLSCLVLAVVNVAGSLLTLVPGPSAHGFGALAASATALLVALVFLRRGLRDLEFHTFFRQPVAGQVTERTGAGAAAAGLGRYVIRGGRVLVALAVLVPAVVLDPTRAGAEDGVPILVLFKGSDGATVRANEFSRFGEAPARALGFAPTYRDVERGLPTDAEMQAFHAVVTWYRGATLEHPAEYVEWLSRQLWAGRKVVVLGNFGAYADTADHWLPAEAVNRFFRLLGLEYRNDWSDRGDTLAVVSKDTTMVEAQIPLDLADVNHYLHFVSRHPGNRVYLALRRLDLADSDSAVVVRTPLGGFALDGYLYRQTVSGPRLRLDVARFLAATLPGRIAPADLPPRRALALLKHSESPTPLASRIGRYAAGPLLDIGVWLDYRYVDDGFPAGDAMAPYAAVVSWFETSQMTEGASYPAWLLEQIRAGRKVLILGSYGAFKSVRGNGGATLEWWVPANVVNSFFYPFGLEYRGDWTAESRLLRVVAKDTAMVEAEIPLRADALPQYERFASVDARNESFLVLDRTDRTDGRSSVVVRTPYGCLADQGYVDYWDEGARALRFRLALARFLERCLSGPTPPLPAPLPLVTHEELLADRASTATPPPQVPALEAPAGAREYNRRVLALYKGSEASAPLPPGREVDFLKDQGMARGHSYAELILNHLGLVVDHWNVEDGLPPAAIMERYRGVVTWFSTGTMRDALGYARWVQAQVAAGRRVVILGDLGASIDRDTDVAVRAPELVLGALGFRHQRLLNGEGRLRIVKSDPAMMGFEDPVRATGLARLDSVVQATAPGARVYLTVAQGDSPPTDLVAVTPAGGIALQDAAFFAPEPDRHTLQPLRAYLAAPAGATAPAPVDPPTRWRLDPFRFFAEALGLEQAPRPDVTTLNGRRILISHVDGDGLLGVSRIDPTRLCGEIVRDELFARFNLPISASVITSEIEAGGTATYNGPLLLARSIFRLDNVEPASHSTTHPFDWRDGSRDIRWQNGQWVVGRLPLDLDREIVGSVRFIDRNLVPPGKRTTIFFWSGSTNPSAAALALTRVAGVRNLNGGDPILDGAHPSLSYLAPLTTRYGDGWQVHAAASADVIYAERWLHDFGAQRRVLEHFERTEAPRRLYPLHVYYHYFSGERREAVDALTAIYRDVLERKPAPLFVSEYAAIVEDFLATRIGRLADGGWEIRNAGALRTIRFDDVSGVPDLARSRGVLGYDRANGSLYVHLDEGTVHEIQLTQVAAPGLRLHSATHYIEDWRATPAGVTFSARGLGPARIVIAGLSPATIYDVTVDRTAGGPAETVLAGPRTTDADGNLLIETELHGYHGRYRINVTGGGR